MKDNGSRFYYSRLTDGEKNLYDRICEALLRFEPALSIHAGMGKAFTVDTKKIMTAVLFDNPVFSISTAVGSSPNRPPCTFSFFSV